MKNNLKLKLFNMGAWGYKNFENDTAADWFGTKYPEKPEEIDLMKYTEGSEPSHFHDRVDEIIEVKASFSSVKEGQFVKLYYC